MAQVNKVRTTVIKVKDEERFWKWWNEWMHSMQIKYLARYTVESFVEDTVIDITYTWDLYWSEISYKKFEEEVKKLPKIIILR